MELPDIRSALERGLDEAEGEWDDSVLHASDLSVALPNGDGSCPIALRKRLRGEESQDPHLGMKIMFSHGQAIHDRFAELLEEGLDSEWEVRGVEVDLTEELTEALGRPVTGRCDLILYNVVTKETVVLDWKTVRGKAMRWIRKEGVKPSHEMQVCTYAMALDAAWGVVVYVDREGQNGVEAFGVARDDGWVAAYVRAVDRLLDMDEDPEPIDVGMGPQLSRRRNKGPDSLTLKQPWQASYCDMADCPCSEQVPFEKKLVAYVDDGELEMKDGYEELRPIVERLLDEESDG